jgi:hypothetical protein
VFFMVEREQSVTAPREPRRGSGNTDTGAGTGTRW